MPRRFAPWATPSPLPNDEPTFRRPGATAPGRFARAGTAVLLVSALLLAFAPADAKKRDRLGDARKLLTQAAAASKRPQVKSGIQRALTLVNGGKYVPAREQVRELKQTAALSGEPATVVLRLVDAEDALDDVVNRVKKGRKP